MYIMYVCNINMYVCMYINVYNVKIKIKCKMNKMYV